MTLTKKKNSAQCNKKSRSLPLVINFAVAFACGSRKTGGAERQYSRRQSVCISLCVLIWFRWVTPTQTPLPTKRQIERTITLSSPL